MAMDSARLELPRIARLLITAAPLLLLTGCLQDNSVAGGAGPSGSNQRAPTISGVPTSGAVVGMPYSFVPAVTDPDGDALVMSVTNLPDWASFDPATGAIAGTPGAGDAGTYAGIVITVSDGTSTVSLPAFQVVVAQNGGLSASLSWNPPTTDALGVPLSDLAGFRIHYGTQPGNLASVIEINNPGITRFVIENLNAGRYYFAVSAYDVNGNTSNQSQTVSGLIG